jgi:hypothetical protein
MSTEANSYNEDNACSRLKDALKACAENKPLKVEIEFTHFVTLLKEHLVSAAVPRDKNPKTTHTSKDINTSAFNASAASAQTYAIFPTDTIPLDLIALANCLHEHNLGEYADTSIAAVVSLIAEDDKLSFLRQNVYQEVAKYFTRRGKYIEADELLIKQLKIVSLKGSKVLQDFVKVNRLINKGNMQLANEDFDGAKESFLDALLLMETSPEKHPKQIAFLYESWSKLDDRS